MSNAQIQKTRFLSIGIIVMIVSLVLPTIFARIAVPMEGGWLRYVLMSSIDIFRICFFVGLVCAIIGVVKRRKLKQQLELQGKEE